MRIVCLVMLLVLAAPAGAERVYKWTDAAGNIHYTDAPPQDGEYEVIETGGTRNEPQGPTSGERAKAWRERQLEEQARDAEREAVAGERRQAQAQREENCRRARENARVLEQNTRILMPPEEEGGEPVRMSDEERLRRLEEAREKVREFCDNQ